MAADILLYDSDVVPVGADQVQHIEVTRDIAARFNSMYGEVLTLPKAHVVEATAKVPGIDGEKMSKSYGNAIEVFEEPKKLRKKIMSIQTDSLPVEAPKDPEASSIFALYKLFATPEQQEQLANRYRAGDMGYGEAKQTLYDASLVYFAEARERHAELSASPARVNDILAAGAEKARKKAREVLERVRKATGLGVHTTHKVLKAIIDRYGDASARPLLGVTNAEGRVTWPNRDAYDTNLSIYVGPDAVRWAWCAPPTGQLNLPSDFQVQGVQLEGRTISGSIFPPVECAPSALSHTTDAGTRLLLRIESPELTLAYRQREPAPAVVEWTLLNALFDGIDWSLDTTAHLLRRDRFSFATPARPWVLQFLESYREADRHDLSNGLTQRLPTAMLTTTVDDLAQLADVEEDVVAVTHLLSLATGSSVGGTRRRILQRGSAIEDTYKEWAIFGAAYHYNQHALICNCPELGGALRDFLAAAVEPFRRQDNDLALSIVINYLEQARSNNVADVRIGLCVLAVESLTHRLCLREGLAEDQLMRMNIQQKLNRARNNLGMAFIDRRFAEEARETIRNPLLHTGQIPSLSIAEKVQWYNDLYALTFKMLLFLLNYKGKWFDLSKQWQVVDAP
jgi:hypothetical protein